MLQPCGLPSGRLPAAAGAPAHQRPSRLDLGVLCDDLQALSLRERLRRRCAGPPGQGRSGPASEWRRDSRRLGVCALVCNMLTSVYMLQSAPIVKLGRLVALVVTNVRRNARVARPSDHDRHAATPAPWHPPRGSRHGRNALRQNFHPQNFCLQMVHWHARRGWSQRQGLLRAGIGRKSLGHLGLICCSMCFAAAEDCFSSAMVPPTLKVATARSNSLSCRAAP